MTASDVASAPAAEMATASIRGTKRPAPSSPSTRDGGTHDANLHRRVGDIRRSFAADAAAAVPPDEPSTSSTPYVAPSDIAVAYTSTQIDAYVHQNFYPNNPSRPDDVTNDAGGIRLVGLDVEARPSRVKGITHPVALVQVTTPDNTGCLLAHVYDAMGLFSHQDKAYVPGSNRRPFPPALSKLLNDRTVIAVGQGVAEDLRQISRNFPEIELDASRGFVDLAAIVDFYDVPATGLGNLAKHAGFHDVSKPKSVQVSNWSKSPLTDAQIRYAAQDAALSLWVLQRLYDGYAPTGVGIETWSASFAGCETRKHLVARCERLDGVTDPTMRSHMKQRLATWTREESDAKAVKAFRKASLALATHDEGVATGQTGVNARSTLQILAQHRDLDLRFDYVPRQEAGHNNSTADGGAIVRCFLDGVEIGEGRDVSKKKASRVAAVDALEKIRMMRDGEWWCEALVGAFRANARRMKTPVTEGLEWQCGHGGGGACSLARSGVAPGN